MARYYLSFMVFSCLSFALLQSSDADVRSDKIHVLGPRIIEVFTPECWSIYILKVTTSMPCQHEDDALPFLDYIEMRAPYKVWLTYGCCLCVPQSCQEMFVPTSPTEPLYAPGVDDFNTEDTWHLIHTAAALVAWKNTEFSRFLHIPLAAMCGDDEAAECFRDSEGMEKQFHDLAADLFVPSAYGAGICEELSLAHRNYFKLPSLHTEVTMDKEEIFPLWQAACSGDIESGRLAIEWLFGDTFLWDELGVDAVEIARETVAEKESVSPLPGMIIRDAGVDPYGLDAWCEVLSERFSLLATELLARMPTWQESSWEGWMTLIGNEYYERSQNNEAYVLFRFIEKYSRLSICIEDVLPKLEILSESFEFEGEEEGAMGESGSSG